MQDMILTKLADIGDLKVIARTSTAKYASHPDDLKAIAQQLGVATILEGSVQKSGNQVLINVQLIDANTNAHLWAEAYPRTLDNIFGVEGEVAQKVAQALDAKLTIAETQRVSAIPTQNLQAYNLFLQGEYYRSRCFNEELIADCQQAIRDYQLAIQQDQQFALAFARLALAQLFQGRLYGGDDSAPVHASAKANVDRALALAPQLAEAHLAQGIYEDYVNGDFDASLKAFRIARSLKPRDSEIIFDIGLNHMHRGQWQAAIQSYREALALDPRNLGILGELAIVYNLAGHYADAAAVATQGLAIDPESSFMLHELVESTLNETGNPDRALAVLDAAPASVQNQIVILEDRAWVLFLRRDYPAARSVLARLPSSPALRTGFVDSFMGDIERAAGNLPAARAHYQRAAALIEAKLKVSTINIDKTALHRDLAYVYAGLGRGPEALEQFRLMNEFMPRAYLGYAGTANLEEQAELQATLGNADGAVSALDRLMASDNGRYYEPVTMLKLDPTWDPIRNDPRFQALLKKYGASQPAAATSSGAASRI